MKNVPQTIDAYMDGFNPEIVEIMIKVRSVIHEAVPDLKECISWGMPTFKLNGKNLVHFAGNKHHLGFYPGTEAIEKFKNNLTGFKTSKGGIQFPYNKPIPTDLIAEITRYNASEIKALF
ncbi:DUF1801 domain-containing protein [Parabacteroides sp. OttesenSCG-928-G21]|nr:DUF1801 domain-containing protein [Parabacteroides sp. OttesenSCG-928-G21]